MESPLTLRLDKETRDKIARIARRRRLSTSQIIREAIEAWIIQQESLSPHEAVVDLIGIVHGGKPDRSSNMGRRFTELLKKRGGRS